MATEGEEAFVESVEDPLMGEPGDDRDHFSQSHFHQQQQQQSPTGFSYVFMGEDDNLSRCLAEMRYSFNMCTTYSFCK